ncbi:hypothetical protein CC86DRAFT_378266 [Ophiobolus disseminans]|uniref:DUF7730 domain-containing protein n=1 Tax=Ophiobolus disseminans TaxID=1469910 RepID=A0A6A7AE43_9PLEO|nr:hypothetical protein CC86DRAFT_378266 [Ophiobolus disseminans]
MSNKALNTITLRNQQESPLLRLPGELRNRVYDEVFRDTSLHVGYRHIGVWDPATPYFIRVTQENEGEGNSRVKGIANISGLITVCQQIYDETKTFSLSRTVFYFENSRTRQQLLATHRYPAYCHSLDRSGYNNVVVPRVSLHRRSRGPGAGPAAWLYSGHARDGPGCTPRALWYARIQGSQASICLRFR